MKSGAFSGLEANKKKKNVSAFNSKSNARRAPTSFTLPRKTSLAFSALFFCEQASQPACVGADAKCSSNSHSHILDVCARAHARIKDGGKLWQLWPEGSTKHGRPPSESIYADCTDALLQHQCGQQQHTQWKRSSLKKIKPKINYKGELEMFCLQAALGFSSHPKKANVLLL